MSEQLIKMNKIVIVKSRNKIGIVLVYIILLLAGDAFVIRELPWT